jgi:mycobactin lysine-N-oxygenase
MALSEKVNIAVIGAGPKAAALVAKADILRSAGLANIVITIFERAVPGANWNGSHGYTDGKQALCTPAERDVGFPYRSRISRLIDQPLSAKFGWTTYKMATKLYAEWVDGGRRPPSHADFANYIAWVLRTADNKPVLGEVTQLRPQPRSNQWQVEYELTGVIKKHPIQFDAVVVTGPGPAKHVPRIGRIPSRTLFDGNSFWANTGFIAKSLQAQKPEDRYVVVIGGGGTSAAIVAWLARNGLGSDRIDVVASQPLYSRIDSHFENRYFSDNESWRQLSPAQRVTLHERLNRGVVWSSMLGDLANATGLNVVHGYVDGIEAAPARQLVVRVRRWNNERPPLASSLVIDASGFDAWWFRTLLTNEPRSGHWDESDQAALFSSIDSSLRFGNSEWDLPSLHVPGLSQAHGAGLASLMSLGAMSDLILGAYLP